MRAFEGGYDFPEGYTVGKEDWHFAAQLFNRYGIRLQYGELSAIRKRIKNQRRKKRGMPVRGDRKKHSIKWVRKEPNGVIGTYNIRVIAPHSEALVTALPTGTPRRWEVF